RCSAARWTSSRNGACGTPSGVARFSTRSESFMVDEKDLAFVWDMLRAAQAVARFIGGRTKAEYLQDELVQSVVERKIEIIGEAARKMSPTCQAHHPEIPWAKIQGQRHVLAHHYGVTEHDRIWEVATVHVPALTTQLAALLPPEPQGMNPGAN